MAERNTRIRGTQVVPDTIEPSDLKAIDSAADGEVPSYDSATGEFEWIASGGGSDTGVNALVVAASDTPATIKNRADFQCDGTADQSEINTALGIADTVILCPGTFYISASISLASNKSLFGSGNATILKIPNSHNADLNVIVNSDQSSGNINITIKNFIIDGNKVNQTSGTMSGVYFVKSSYSSVCEIIFQQLRTNGIYVVGGSFVNMQFILSKNSFIDITTYGIKIDSGKYYIVDSNFFNCNVQVYDIQDSVISNNVGIGSASVEGMVLTGILRSTIEGNTVRGFTTGNGLELEPSSNKNTVIGNVVENCGQNIHISGDYNIVSDNLSYNCTVIPYGSLRINGIGNLVTNNYIDTSSKGISVNSGGNNNKITNNNIYNCTTGIDISAAAGADNEINNNKFISCTTEISDSGTGTIGIWINYSAISTIEGWSSYDNKEIYYKKTGKTVFVNFDIRGPSDSTLASFTLPYSRGSAPAFTRAIIYAMDNGSHITGMCSMTANSSGIYCYPSVSSDNWTASGTKRVIGQLCYESA